MKGSVDKKFATIVPPKLKRDQISLLRADINTGHVLKTNNELYLGLGRHLKYLTRLNQLSNL